MTIPHTSSRKYEEAIALLNAEAKALVLLANQLDSSFGETIECLFNTQGRIAVTGMGKSGLVGRKVAATLSSTGTPSYFIHPGEASHGDLGLLSPKDALLALSYSGNTRELADIINYATLAGIPIIGMTRNKDSLLGRHADHLLLLPNLPEADSLDCAPTTSTTMQMALGDAIAITLMKRRGISAQDFHRWHPGGSLGQRLHLVRDLMHTGDSLPLADINFPMSEAIILMSSKGFGIIGAVHEGRLAGIITDGDLRRHMDSTLLDKKVCEVMTHSPYVISGDKLAAEAMKTMREKKITSLFVMEDDAPIGLIHIHDLLQAGFSF